MLHIILVEFRICPLRFEKWRKPPIQLGLFNEFCCLDAVLGF